MKRSGSAKIVFWNTSPERGTASAAAAVLEALWRPCPPCLMPACGACGGAGSACGATSRAATGRKKPDSAVAGVAVCWRASALGFAPPSNAAALRFRRCVFVRPQRGRGMCCGRRRHDGQHSQRRPPALPGPASARPAEKSGQTPANWLTKSTKTPSQLAGPTYSASRQ